MKSAHGGVGLVTVSCVLAFACASTQLLASPGPASPSLYIAPVHYNHTLEGPIGGSGDGAPTDWFVAQWNNPTALGLEPTRGEQGPCSAYARAVRAVRAAMRAVTLRLRDGNASCVFDHRPGVDWYVANGNMRVCVYGSGPNGSHAVEFGQNGEKDLKCGLEFDAFLSPTGSVYRNVPKGEVRSQPLASLRSLNMSFGFELVYSSISPRCGSGNQCGSSGHVDYGYATAAITLNNAASDQSLFYQIGLWDSRSSAECDHQPCKPSRNWFFKKQPYGVSDSVASFHQPCIQSPGPRKYYNLNILPMVSDAILHPPSDVSGLDPDLSHWEQTGMYIGLGLQGSAVQTCVVSDIQLVEGN